MKDKLASRRENHVNNHKPLIPNRQTVKAIEAVRRGELTAVNSVEELFKSLNDGQPDTVLKMQ